ncbi:MAG: hypothetical protein WD557_12310 [Dehalococcoidia bacterium]
MFTDFQIEADRRMADYNREAERVFMASEAEDASTPTSSARRGVRFPMPEWLRSAPFVLRGSTR